MLCALLDLDISRRRQQKTQHINTENAAQPNLSSVGVDVLIFETILVQTFRCNATLFVCPECCCVVVNAEIGEQFRAFLRDNKCHIVRTEFMARLVAR